MTTITLKKDFYTVPPKIEGGRWSTVNEAEYHVQQLKVFFSTEKGSRPLIPEYGFDYEYQGITSDEMRAIILIELRQWFSDLTIIKVDVYQVELGSYFVEITFSFDEEVNKVTITL